MQGFLDYLKEYFTGGKGVFGGVWATTFTWMFGSWEVGIQILFYLMIIDYVSGMMCGSKDKNLSSEVGFNGLKKKFTMLIILTLAVMLDRLLNQTVFRTLVIYFYIAMEGISILENAAKLGVPVPEKLKEMLVQLKEGNKKEIKNNEEA